MMFYCDYMYLYLYRFVSTLLNALVLMVTKMHMYTQHHTHHVHTMYTQDGYCPLYVASQEGHDRIVKKLLKAGATVDLQTKVEYCYYLFICHL